MCGCEMILHGLFSVLFCGLSSETENLARWGEVCADLGRKSELHLLGALGKNMG